LLGDGHQNSDASNKQCDEIVVPASSPNAVTVRLVIRSRGNNNIRLLRHRRHFGLPCTPLQNG
jgi:hypothetical protein